MSSLKKILFRRKILALTLDIQFLFDLCDFLNSKIQIPPVVGGGYLGAKTRSSIGNPRIGETYHLNTHL